MSQESMNATHESFRLDGRHALVTGGASGIGEATCKELARAGASVIVADIHHEQAKSLASTLGNATALHLDVTKPESLQAAVAAIGKLDILVNNAGIASVGDITKIEPDEFDRVMEVNVKSVYLVTRAFLPLLLAAHGCIVNIGSVAGLVGIKQRFAYCTSKGAVIAMTRQLAVEYPKELRVNCICPGTVQTPFVEGYLEKYHAHEKDKVRAELNARQPIGRVGQPEEIASLVRYVCSDEAAFMTGALLPIDGGWTAA
ncbi:NAD(P)-dependent dehydrogenase (short-subunit alcohol dehydrogenase family) [Silvibacterium bohemicum]|uniref:NAD(P)-dependent dehydrogenase (Short-subunit alcohol dehydrogenase family) n=1 Tax=Silvibacterium bohemicum TaxID=1577686 RepID=A0A841JZI3_9BACT|nr:SDR family oxidoreductase [Silvibacterium bohemicum]MBB6143404.1 NAD(P)-dependent dehydrogenase (short-subunit alcohol dehydrogenase family) [Silvibacterium bohemicum]